MGKNSFGSKAVSSGYSHAGPVAGAPVVASGATRSDNKFYKGAMKKNPEVGVQARASGSAPKGTKFYKEGAGVKV